MNLVDLQNQTPGLVGDIIAAVLKEDYTEALAALSKVEENCATLRKWLLKLEQDKKENEGR